MAFVLAFLSLLLIAVSLYGVLLPPKLMAWVQSFVSRFGIGGAVVARIVLALLLWFSAPMSRTPLTFMVLALLALAAAAALPLIGSARLMTLIGRITNWPPSLIRVAALLGAAFGAFIFWSSSTALGAR